ncbi:hypothetical protein L198_08246 [Cryptococcus wingfieldii CBS 7118]|uniref:Uncharacterized protein n=1 Tax=Cryptococcus wingfieldii CBS 7118 TaxID=1295528 RepID=A0A1E3HFT1_9TREE|nr:hypothetical protein L198_08246 [Cryptococcus wingfieldii CBS 7118]ODN74281.1 hypothetical protein L198_08246 [Cryptococcus wingfieldii CBS 7118]
MPTPTPSSTVGEERQEQIKKFCQFDVRRQLLEIHLMQHASLQRDEADQAQEAIDLVPTYVDEVMASAMLPAYKDKKLQTYIIDMIERLNPGTIPAAATTAYTVVQKAIRQRLTNRRHSVLTTIKGSINKKTNLWSLAAEILPEGNQRTSAVLGRVAMLRGLAQEFADQEETAAVAESEKAKKAVTFWDFVDPKLKGFYEEGRWTAMAK